MSKTSSTNVDELLVSALKKLRLSESTPKRVSFTSKTPEIVTYTTDSSETDIYVTITSPKTPEKETPGDEVARLSRTPAFVSNAILLIQKKTLKTVENIKKRSPVTSSKRSPGKLSPFKQISSSFVATDKIDHSHIKPVTEIKKMFSRKPATPKHTATRKSLTKLPSNANLRNMWQRKTMNATEKSVNGFNRPKVAISDIGIGKPKPKVSELTSTRTKPLTETNNCNYLHKSTSSLLPKKQSYKDKEGSTGILKAGSLKNSKKVVRVMSKEDKENQNPQIKIKPQS